MHEASNAVPNLERHARTEGDDGTGEIASQAVPRLHEEVTVLPVCAQVSQAYAERAGDVPVGLIATARVLIRISPDPGVGVVTSWTVTSPVLTAT